MSEGQQFGMSRFRSAITRRRSTGCGPREDTTSKLMVNVLHHLAARGFLLNFVTQTSIAHLPKDKFETVPIPLPPTTAEQDAIAEALSDADALIESLDHLITKKRQIKQGAMQELLTGKKRLPGFATSGEYRQTELGSIPKDWDVASLSKICSMKSGREHYQGPDRFTL